MKRSELSIQVLQFIDGCTVAISYWLMLLLHNPLRSLLGMSPLQSNFLNDAVLVITASVILVPVILEMNGFYVTSMKGVMQAFKKALAAIVISSVILVSVMIALKMKVQSRFFFLGIPPLLVVLITFRSWLISNYYKHRIKNESRKQAVQLIGGEEEISSFMERVSGETAASWDLQEGIDLGTIKVNDLVSLFKERSVAQVIFLPSRTEFNRVSRAVELCESMGIEVMVATDFLRTKLSIPEVEQVAGRTMITLRSTPSVSYSLVAKKLLDRIGAFILILLTLPFWIFAILGIKISSPEGSVFFKQKRAGLYGRPFTMWKFRTMRPNAEAMRDEIIAEHGNQMDGPVFKLDKDPRVFAFGDILRRTSIDELPQLLNVLFGEMSLVGPRPLPLVEVEGFQKSEHRRRLSVKPGITCYWQAGGRNSITSFEEWVDLDLKYIDNWSFLLDVKLLLMTVPAVLLKKGAK